MGEATQRRVLLLIANLDGAADADVAEEAEEDDAGTLLSLIKSMPGKVSLESMLAEIRKLEGARGIGLPVGVFADVPPKVLASWRQKASVESPSHLRRRDPDAAATLLAALVHEREREITDDLVDLLIGTVHRINASAEKKVTEELMNAFKRVDGKEAILFAIAEASLAKPRSQVKTVVYPAVRGGEETLRDLVREYKTKGPVYRRTVQMTLKASYSNHYRRGLIALLRTLTFGSTAADHPVLAAVELVKRHADATAYVYYPTGEDIPEHRGLDGDWASLVFRTDAAGVRRTAHGAFGL